MARKPRDQLFKKSDVFRLIESAKQKNLPIARIDVEPDGKLSLIVGEPGKTAPADDNDLDNWMAKHHADQAQGD